MELKDEIALEIREYRRPWKLASLCTGIGLLIWGAKAIGAPDWDIPISLIMASLTYLFAPWSLRVILQRQWSRLPLALLLCWFSVDGCYWLYWSWQDPQALALMRSSNAPASLSLYAICGLIWLYRGSLYEGLRDRNQKKKA